MRVGGSSGSRTRAGVTRHSSGNLLCNPSYSDGLMKSNPDPCQSVQFGTDRPPLAILKSSRGESEVESPAHVHQEGVTGAEMKKIMALLLLAVFALSAVTPAYAYHHRRHHRYHGGQPVVVLRW